MPTQAEINQVGRIADHTWNIYQTMDDLNTKLRGMGTVDEMASTIPQESFDAITDELRKVYNELSGVDWEESDEKIYFDNLDSQQEGWFKKDSPKLSKEVFSRWQELAALYAYGITKRGSNFDPKGFVNDLEEVRRDDVFPLFAFCETVKKMKPDDEESGEKSIKFETPSAGLSEKGQNVIKKFIFDAPDLIDEYTTLGDELYANKFDEDLMMSMRSVCMDIAERTSDVYDVFKNEKLKFECPDSVLDAHDCVIVFRDLLGRDLDSPRKRGFDDYLDGYYQKAIKPLKQMTDDLRATLTDPVPTLDME